MSSIQRRFFLRRPMTGEPICIIQGESGFYPATIGGDNSPEATDAKLAAANAIFNNTEADIEAALTCSMFGWDIPAANNISSIAV